MSGVKHTPGPWHTSGVYIDSDFGMVGHANYSSGLSRGFPEANARLIAAAPDLLEALAGLLGNAEIARFHLKDTEEGMIVGSALFDTINQAQASISRARGES